MVEWTIDIWTTIWLTISGHSAVKDSKPVVVKFALFYIRIFVSTLRDEATSTYRARNLILKLWCSSWVKQNIFVFHLWPLLLRWFNFNPNMDK